MGTDKSYIARTANNRIQTVKDHCLNVSNLTSKTLKPFGLESVGRLAGVLHDAGKCSDEFQRYIRDESGKRGSVTHSFAGGSYILSKHHTGKMDIQDLTAEILSYAIAGHHGIFDAYSNGENGFLHVLEKQPEIDGKAMQVFFDICMTEKELDKLFESSKTEVQSAFSRICTIVKDSSPKGMENSTGLFLITMLSRLVCSALVDADRSDSASFCGIPTSVTGGVDWSETVESVERTATSFPCTTDMDKARKDFSNTCKEASEMPSGRIYRLDLPTGGGKTLSSLRFAVNHAMKHNQERVVYVSPLLSIIDQNEAVMRNAAGDKNVIAHHSDAVRGDDTQADILRQNWNAPIIVTTLTRVLETFLKGGSSNIRLFRSLGNATIIFDEVQSVQRRDIGLFNVICNFLSAFCGSTILLCSATQPTFGFTGHPMLVSESPIVPADLLEKYGKLFERTEIINDGIMDMDGIVDLAKRTMDGLRSLLMVCNTKKEARGLFLRMSDAGFRTLHLSASMCMAHRRDVLDRIMTLLSTGEKVVCVSTQVIEAGVDISFDSVIRLSAGLDNVVQAAGRCNRHGESPEPGPVHIVELAGERLEGLKDIADGKCALTAVLHESSRITEESVDGYYRRYLDQTVREQEHPTNEVMTIFSMLADNSNNPGYYIRSRMATAGRLYSVFDDDGVDVVTDYGDGGRIIGLLSSERAERDPMYRFGLLNEAKPFTVSINKSTMERFQGLAYEKNYLDGTGILMLSPWHYDKNTGVTTEECTTTIL